MAKFEERHWKEGFAGLVMTYAEITREEHAPMFEEFFRVTLKMMDSSEADDKVGALYLIENAMHLIGGGHVLLAACKLKSMLTEDASYLQDLQRLLSSEKVCGEFTRRLKMLSNLVTRLPPHDKRAVVDLELAGAVIKILAPVLPPAMRVDVLNAADQLGLGTWA